MLQTNAVSDRPADEKEKARRQSQEKERQNEGTQDVIIDHEKCLINFKKFINSGLPD